MCLQSLSRPAQVKEPPTLPWRVLGWTRNPQPTGCIVPFTPTSSCRVL